MQYLWHQENLSAIKIFEKEKNEETNIRLIEFCTMRFLYSCAQIKYNLLNIFIYFVKKINQNHLPIPILFK